LHFKAAFEVLPEFSIDGYQDVKVERPSAELTDAEVDTELARIRDSRSTMEPVTEERALADGDFAQISFTGNVQPAEAGSEEQPEQPISGQDVMVQVGGPNTLESFNAALRGATAGQELKFEVSYPEDFGERKLAGKRVAYDLEVKGIKKKIEPELNDEFAKELGPYESLADFTRQLREHLAADKQRKVQSETYEPSSGCPGATFRVSGSGITGAVSNRRPARSWPAGARVARHAHRGYAKSRFRSLARGAADLRYA
jgi:trigger factor